MTQTPGHYDANGEYHGQTCAKCDGPMLALFPGWGDDERHYCSQHCADIAEENRLIACGDDGTEKDGHDFYMKRGAYGRGF